MKFSINLDFGKKAEINKVLQKLIKGEIPVNQILNERLRVGDVVQHFKREFLPPEQIGSPKYLYIIKSLAVNSETGETMVIYQALY